MKIPILWPTNRNCLGY